MAQGIGYLIAFAGSSHATGSLYSLAALCAAICVLSARFGYAAGRREHVKVASNEIKTAQIQPRHR
jgi:MFS transporter, CP family, cyanate transporter